MMPLLVLAILSICVSGTYADCKSPQGNTCLLKKDMGGLASNMLGGDPCFLSGDSRWCFVSTAGNMEPCSCTSPDCGCGTAPVIPKCDNSAAPSNPDCNDDKNTYCSLDNGKGKNTMCQYCGVDLTACNKLCTRDLSDDDIKVIVNKHNELRRQVAKGLETRGVNGPQPKAADMWADQCPNGLHDKNRLSPGFQSVGQNMADSWSSVNSPEKSLADKVTGWYNEVAAWPSANLGAYSEAGATGVVGHYTQLIWGATTKVGCGFVAYIDASQPRYQYRQKLVCNYGIGGNMLGGKVYTATTGDAGSACPNGTNDGLCKQ